jgi:ABC-type branched-subunit amino acid transport system substrate-binding protein
VEDAIAEIDKQDRYQSLRGRLKHDRADYRSDQDGIEKLQNLIEECKADIVLGPTDSGVYLGASRRNLQRYKIPVISPLVAASEPPNEPGGWFFRVNIDAMKRIDAVIDYLRPFLLSSMAILYPDTGFGYLSERHFYQQSEERWKQSYHQLKYTASDADKRRAVDLLLESRPEAVGILGAPDDVAVIVRLMRSMSGWNPYRPIIFTIVDPSMQPGKLKSTAFVSLSNGIPVAGEAVKHEKGTPTAKPDTGYDEIEALSFDTTRLVLEALKSAYSKRARWNPEAFRDEFTALLQQLSAQPNLLGPTRSRMEFRNYTNTAVPAVYITDEDGKIRKAPHLETLQPGPFEFGKFFALVKLKVDLAFRRFGLLLSTNLLLLFLLALVLSFLHLYRWFEGQLRKALFSVQALFFFYPMVGGNFLVAVVLYFYLGEIGAIRYDSWQAALIIGLTPTALLRSTFFETPTGKAIGLADYYDGLIRWLSERMMIRRYKVLQQRVSILTYFNPRNRLASKLRRLYENAESDKMRDRLEKDLKADVDRAATYMGKRRVIARRLLRRFSWKELQTEFAPPEFQGEKPPDPVGIVHDCTDYCVTNEESRKKLNELLEKCYEGLREQMPDLGEDSKSFWEYKVKQFRGEFQERLRDLGPHDATEVMVRELVTRFHFKPSRLKEEKLLPEDYNLPTSDSGKQREKA